MIPEVKVLHSADIEDVPKWTPEGDDVCFWLELSIGLPASDRADVFQVCVATPAGLKSGLGRSIKHRGSANARPIVLQQYCWPALEDAIRSRLEACAGGDWLEVQEKLRGQFVWEYERYK